MPELPLETLRTMAEGAQDLTSDARNASERCRDYYDNHQWTAEEIAALKKRRQPVITFNRIQRKVDAMIGIEQKSRTDPRAIPRNPQDEAAAEAATKALVFIDDQTRFDQKRSLAFENLLIEGYGGCEIIVEQKRGKFEIVVNRIRWEELIFDPHSREKDFSDAAFMGSMKWMTLDTALALYQGAYDEQAGADAMPLEDILKTGMSAASNGQTYEDRPYKATFWADGKSKRVRVAQMYYIHGGVWYLSIFCGGGIIINGPSPYQDEDGKPCNPMVLMTAYIDRENRRYGLVTSMMGAQDEINHRRGKALHLSTQRQTQTVKGAVSVDMLKRELSKPDGNVEVDIDAVAGARDSGVPAFQILPTNDMAAAHFQLLQEAKNEIDQIGPNASLLGQLRGDQSGRAIMAQQQAGMAELAPIYDSLRDWTLRCYRQMWLRVRQFWTEERWVRVTDETQAPEWLVFNRQVGMQVQVGPDGMPMIAPQLENPVGQMDVDIIIEDAPDYVTLRQEEFEQLAQMAQQGMPIPPEMLIEASSVRNKKRILEMLEAQKQEAAQAQQAAMQAQMQAEQGKMQLEGQKVQISGMAAQAKAAKDMADANQTNAETQSGLIQRRLALGV
jgi:hypothetical protein